MSRQIPLYKRDIFYDAYITAAGEGALFLANDYITHHENPLKDPNPVQFLKIRSDVLIQFQFDFKDNLLTHNIKESLFRKLLLILGVGAKTNVGYGQFAEHDSSKLRHPLPVRHITIPTGKDKDTTSQTNEHKIPADAANYLKRSNKNIVAQIAEITADKVILTVKTPEGKKYPLEKKIEKLKKELKIDEKCTIDKAWEFKINMEQDFEYSKLPNFKVSFLK